MTSSLSTSSDYANTCEEDDTWVLWFIQHRENKGLIEVDSSFIEDQFNLYSLNELVKDFDRSWHVIKGEKQSRSPHNEAILYYMIHQRYLLTKQGMEKMAHRVSSRYYGTCGRVLCKSFPYVPVGLSDSPGADTVKLFCYRCGEVYIPSNHLRDMDGCAFGTTFPHLLSVMRPDLFTKEKREGYVPRVFGFRIYP